MSTLSRYGAIVIATLALLVASSGCRTAARNSTSVASAGAPPLAPPPAPAPDLTRIEQSLQHIDASLQRHTEVLAGCSVHADEARQHLSAMHSTLDTIAQKPSNAEQLNRIEQTIATRLDRIVQLMETRAEARSDAVVAALIAINQTLSSTSAETPADPAIAKKLQQIHDTLTEWRNAPSKPPAPPEMWSQSFLFTILGVCVALLTYLSVTQQNIRDKIAEHREDLSPQEIRTYDAVVTRHSRAIVLLIIPDLILLALAAVTMVKLFRLGGTDRGHHWILCLMTAALIIFALFHLYFDLRALKIWLWLSKPGNGSGRICRIAKKWSDALDSRYPAQGGAARDPGRRLWRAFRYCFPAADNAVQQPEKNLTQLVGKIAEDLEGIRTAVQQVSQSLQQRR